MSFIILCIAAYIRRSRRAVAEHGETVECHGPTVNP